MAYYVQYETPYDFTLRKKIEEGMRQEFGELFKTCMKYSNTTCLIFEMDHSTLTTGEIALVDAVLTNPPPEPLPTIFQCTETISIEKKILNKGNYKVLSRYIFKGGTAVRFSTNSYMEWNASSYDIKVFDITNSVLVLESNLTNTESDVINIMGTTVSVSPTRAIWEIQGRVNVPIGMASAYLDGLIIDYNTN